MARRRVFIGFGVGLVLTLILVAIGTKRYRGLMEALWNQSQLIDIHETWNNQKMLAYMANILAKLSRNSETGMYDFEVAKGQTDEIVEQGMLAYHMGDFSVAIEAFETAIQEQGESTELTFWLAISYMRHRESVNALDTEKPGRIDIGGRVTRGG